RMGVWGGRGKEKTAGGRGIFFFFKKKDGIGDARFCLVGSEMCKRESTCVNHVSGPYRAFAKSDPP
ncbi:hypothetical protein, partial [Pseudomonas sp. PA-5-4B]|uniref:hypothetical protein n=1 Tax=Pseudomonas sp. PA-5-4B TaxID=2665478 RepID=UPI001F2D228D